ncbi:MAG: hypothetical protein Q9190_004437, partial [Brigantiaea leucoxantha]
MVCTVAALNAFLPRHVAQQVLKNGLFGLLKTTDSRKDVLASQYNNRVNSWRSAAEVRGLSGKARQVRYSLLQSGVVLEGLMPAGESPLLVDFLLWLMAGETTMYTTSSSDIAGIGVCLSRLGIDILSVSGLEEFPDDSPCRLQYSPHCVYQNNGRNFQVSNIFSRIPCTTVSLKHLEESLTKFPLETHTSNRCRDAWIAGQKAAAFVGCVPYVEEARYRKHQPDDLTYVFYNKGSESVRTRARISMLAESLGFVVNRELCQGLEQVLQREPDANIDWLDEQVID